MLTFRGGSADTHSFTCQIGSRKACRYAVRRRGAELVSEDEARAAIQRGEKIVIDNAVSLSHLTDVRLEKEPGNRPSWYAVVLAYREAGMFVNYLRESDGPAFDRMMNAILDDRPFKEAVTVGYHDDVRSLWQKFIGSLAEFVGGFRSFRRC
jgi:hypothetical protein